VVAEVTRGTGTPSVAKRDYFPAVAVRNGPCFLCHRPVDDLHHIEPLGVGGSNRQENRVGLCKDCHQDIHKGLATNTAIHIIPPIVNRAIDQAHKDANTNNQCSTPPAPAKTADGHPGANAGRSSRRSWRPKVKVRTMSKPTGKRLGRPPGGGAGLDIAVATRLTPEEVEALDAIAKKMGFKNRSEAIRFIVQSVTGGGE